MGRNVTSRSWALPEAEDSGRWTNVQDIVGPIKIKADYWIIELDEDYEWVCIGNPKRSGFWILAREKQIDDSLYNYLLTQAVELGFDISNLSFLNRRHERERIFYRKVQSLKVLGG